MQIRQENKLWHFLLTYKKSYIWVEFCRNANIASVIKGLHASYWAAGEWEWLEKPTREKGNEGTRPQAMLECVRVTICGMNWLVRRVARITWCSSNQGPIKKCVYHITALTVQQHDFDLSLHTTAQIRPAFVSDDFKVFHLNMFLQFPIERPLRSCFLAVMTFLLYFKRFDVCSFKCEPLKCFFSHTFKEVSVMCVNNKLNQVAISVSCSFSRSIDLNLVTSQKES